MMIDNVPPATWLGVGVGIAFVSHCFASRKRLGFGLLKPEPNSVQVNETRLGLQDYATPLRTIIAVFPTLLAAQHNPLCGAANQVPWLALDPRTNWTRLVLPSY